MLYSFLMSKIDPINREEVLTAKINDMVREIHGLPADCKNWNTDQLLNLKNLLSSINNSITLKATYAFLDWLKTHSEIVSESELSVAHSEINSKNANSNGFDVMIPNDSPRIFAEVKCNKPVKGKDGFGSAQITGICKDIDKLMEEDTKNHQKVKYFHPMNALKFLVFPDTDEIRAATAKLQAKRAELLIADSVSSFEKEKVYVVFVKL